MSNLDVRSTDALAALETSLGANSQAIADALDTARHRADTVGERLQGQRQRCLSEMRCWQSRIDNADEEESTREYEDNLALWQERMEVTGRSLARVEEAAANLARCMRPLGALTDERSAQARAFLRERARDVEDYAALRAGGGATGGTGTAGGSTGTAAGVAGANMGLGYRRAKRDPRDWLWSRLYGPVPAALPERVGLESLVGPACDQKNTPQCVCYSLAALKHHDEWRDNTRWIQFDPAPIYQQCKARDAAPGEDGTTIRDAMKVATQNGLAADDGRKYHIRGYARLESAQEIFHALSLRKVVLLGLQISQYALSNLSSNAVAAWPEQPDGGHCMTVVGYDAAQQRLRARNSWGTDWGDTGHCWIPCSYLSADPDFDAWTTVCEKVETSAAPPLTTGAEYPRREVFPTSNFAWFDPRDVTLEGDDGPDLKWSSITPEAAAQTLQATARLRPLLDLGDLKSGTLHTAREQLARALNAQGQKAVSEADLNAFDTYFDTHPIRIDSDGRGGFMVINGRHRLYQAQQLGIRSVPVSISNLARRQLAERIAAQSEEL